MKTRAFRDSSKVRLLALPTVAGLILGLAALFGPTRAYAYDRPIEDFVSAQGTVIPGETISWTDPFVTDGASVAFWDYAGVANANLMAAGGEDLGTTMSGQIKEKPLPDGRAEVHVLLHTRNALALAGLWDFDPLTWPGVLVFGHTWQEVAHQNAPAALGDCTLDLRFINTAPGAPLPDMFELFVFLDPNSGREVLFVGFEARAVETLTDGSRLFLQATQIGPLAASPQKPPLFDSYALEQILLKHVGKKEGTPDQH